MTQKIMQKLHTDYYNKNWNFPQARALQNLLDLTQSIRPHTVCQIESSRKSTREREKWEIVAKSWLRVYVANPSNSNRPLHCVT